MIDHRGEPDDVWGGAFILAYLVLMALQMLMVPFFVYFVLIGA